jgi:hypothetical protein
MKIANSDESFPRGKYMGTPRGPLTEASRFSRCERMVRYVGRQDSVALAPDFYPLFRKVSNFDHRAAIASPHYGST